MTHTDTVGEIKKALFDARVLIASAVAFGTSVVASFADFSPPWPSAVSVLTGMVFLLVLILARLSIHEVTAVKKWQWILLIFFFSAYCILFSTFTVVSPRTEKHEVTGFICTDNAKIVYKSCPWLNKREVANANYVIDELWTTPSISAVRYFLLLSWMFTFACIAFIFSKFLRSGSSDKPGGRISES